METESGAKIAIRGKGSVKEGKGRSDAAHTSNQEEDLHCLIMADTEDKVNKAKQLIHNVIETVSNSQLIMIRYVRHYMLIQFQAASIPEGQNELKRNQLRELAALNGTLRDDENQACQNCGQIGHRKYDCPEQRNFTANIICRVCGNAGHMARDCPDRQRGQDWRNSDRGAPGAPRPAGALEPADTEFNNLMQELGAGGAITGSAAPARIEAGAYGDDRNAPKPWARGPTGGPAPWAAGGSNGSGRERDNGSSGGPAPWAAGGSGGGRASDSYGGGYSGGHSSAAPWSQQQSHAAPQQAAYGGYGAYGYGGAPGYDQAYGQQAAPWQQQQAYGAQAGSPPPPPPGDVPPPPPSENPPPPPPPGA